MKRVEIETAWLKTIKGEVLKHSSKDVSAYLDTISIPNIEQYNETHDIVTFLYVGDSGCENVLMLPPGGSNDLEAHLMHKIEETNIWYSTYMVLNNVRFTYYFLPNDPMDDDWEKRQMRITKDPYNTNII